MISKRTSQRQKVDTKAGTVILIDDTGNFQRAAISSLGKEQKVMVLTPYGLCTNPSDDSLAIAMNINGVAANTVAIIDDPKNRKKNLAKGEVALYNYETESVVYLKEDNSIEIESASGAKITLTASGDIELNGNSDFVTAFTDMKTAFDLAITAINNHTHSGVTTGSGTSGTISTPVSISMDAAKVSNVKVP
jgi:phage gp45-like